MSNNPNPTLQDSISQEEIIKLAKLANIRLEEVEVAKYQKEVSSILEMIDQLKKIDTEGVEPTYQVSGNSNVTRPDEITDGACVNPSELLSLSQEAEGNQIKVKKVL